MLQCNSKLKFSSLPKTDFLLFKMSRWHSEKQGKQNFNLFFWQLSCKDLKNTWHSLECFNCFKFKRSKTLQKKNVKNWNMIIFKGIFNCYSATNVLTLWKKCQKKYFRFYCQTDVVTSKKWCNGRGGDREKIRL